MSQRQFWLLKDEPDQLQAIYWLVCETIRVSSVMLQPYCPRKSAQMLDVLGVNEHERSLQHLVSKDQNYFPGGQAEIASTIKLIREKKID